MRLRTAELTTGTALLWGGLGDRGTMQAAHGQQERRAGVLGQLGSRETFTVVILPLGQGSFASLNGTALPKPTGGR